MDFRRVFLAYLEAPQLNFCNEKSKDIEFYTFFSIFPFPPCLGFLGLLSYGRICDECTHADEGKNALSEQRLD